MAKAVTVDETTPEPGSSGSEGSGRFRPEAHLKHIQGKEYLEVKWRLVWFRHDFPIGTGWGIRTEAENVTPQGARYRAQVVDPAGRIVAEGTKTETPGGFADYVEKAETGAIGRALAVCGYGTQFCGEELDEGQRIVDSPVERRVPAQAAAPSPAAKPAAISVAAKLGKWFAANGLTPEQAAVAREEAGHKDLDWKDLTDKQAEAVMAKARSMIAPASAPQTEEEPA